MCACSRSLEAGRVPGSGDDVSRAHVITVSDGAFHGSRADASGSALIRILQANHFDVSGPVVVPDERPLITAAIVAAADAGSDLIVTTGGTGLGPGHLPPQAPETAHRYHARVLGCA